jgi:hypothetical protein
VEVSRKKEISVQIIVAGGIMTTDTSGAKPKQSRKNTIK